MPHCLQDPVDFVRQGVMVSLALVLVAQPEARVAELRKRLQKSVEDKHEEVMCRCVGGGGGGLLLRRPCLPALS